MFRGLCSALAPVILSAAALPLFAGGVASPSTPAPAPSQPTAPPATLPAPAPTPAPGPHATPMPPPAGTSVVAAPVPPQMPLLRPGDRAPRLVVSRWVQGQPVDTYQAGRVYIVSFWTSWSEPALRAIPVLAQAQHDHKDSATVVGVSVWERSPKPIDEFVTTRGGMFNFTVAEDLIADPPEGVRRGRTWTRDWGSSSQQWVNPVRQGVPLAYIINQDGVIAWVGNPIDADFESALAQVVSRTFDLQASARAFERRMTKNNAWGDYRELLGAKKYAQAYAVAREHLKTTFWNEADLLADVAWRIVDPFAGVDEPDTELALAAARRADELTLSQDPEIMRVLSRVLWVAGEPHESVAVLEQAIALASGPQKEVLEAALKDAKQNLPDAPIYVPPADETPKP